MVGCDVLRNTSKDFAVVDGIVAMAENAGALCDVFWVPWHTRHVASANCFPETGSPTCWPMAMAMLVRRSGALHANERTVIIGAPFGANVFPAVQESATKVGPGQIRQPRPADRLGPRMATQPVKDGRLDADEALATLNGARASAALLGQRRADGVVGGGDDGNADHAG